ncbi:MAG: hypothetical protein ISS36_00005 [Candidatus Aenigmarchaeota archaeon]|nr:hypothetical protein [Candidatus Aenigmarchaeota archaeon]
MLDWKILAASFVALIFISSFLIGNLGIKDVVGKIIDKVEGMLTGSPLDGFLTTPSKQDAQTESLELTIYPDNFSLNPNSVTNIKIGEMNLNSFSGDISVDFKENEIVLTQKGTELLIKLPVQKTTIENLEITSISVDGKIRMKTGKWEFNSESGTVEIFGFSGRAEINSESIFFEGNASRVLRE